MCKLERLLSDASDEQRHETLQSIESVIEQDVPVRLLKLQLDRIAQEQKMVTV